MPHLIAGKRILRYIKSSIQTVLLFSHCADLYSDAHWAGCSDSSCSTSGYSVYFGPKLISWNSRKRPTVSKFSSKAENRALAALSTELLWFLHPL